MDIMYEMSIYCYKLECQWLQRHPRGSSLQAQPPLQQSATVDPQQRFVSIAGGAIASFEPQQPPLEDDVDDIDGSMTGFKSAAIDFTGSSGFNFDEQQEDFVSFANSNFVTASANKGNGFGLGSFLLDCGRSEQMQVPP
jgi:hypothetical protein